MEDTYKGESPQKKAARLLFWEQMQAIQKTEFLKKRHVVLASREGGDISVLLGLGVPASHIVAVDIQKSAVRECRAKWPGVEVVLGDVGEVIERVENVGTCFLDFCGPLSGITLETTIRVQRSMRVNSCLGIAVLKGREQESHAPIGKKNRKERRREKHYPQFSGSAKNRIRHMAGTVGSKTEDKSLAARVLAAQTTLMIASPHKAVWFEHAIAYHSPTQDAHGVPMGIFGGRVVDNQRLLWNLDHSGFDTWGMCDVTETTIRERVLAMESSQAALLFNISKGTIAAWRAHDTRGTYVDSAAE